MARTLTKQTHSDFMLRVRRVDPKFHTHGEAAYAKDRRPRRRTVSTLLGFGWIYTVTAIANGRDHIAGSLREGSLPTEYHPWIFAGLTVLLAVSAVMILLHIARWLFHGGNKKRNSGGILLGALGALMLFYTPASLWTQGFGMLDGHSRTVLSQAGAALEDTLPGIRIETVSFVASSSR